MKRPNHRTACFVVLGLWCTTAVSFTPGIGLYFSNTDNPSTLSVSMDPLRYQNLIVKSRIIRPDNPDRLKVPAVDTYAQYKSDGAYQLRLPIDQLMIRPKGHYLVVIDAYVSGIMPSEPPLHTRKTVYVKITDTGVNRIGMAQFVGETQGALANAYSDFSDYFNGQGINNGDSSTTSNSSESECCTDPDPDMPEGPDVDVDGPGGDIGSGGGDTGGETGGGETGGGETGGGETGGGDWNPEDDPLYDIWDCWANGNCEDDPIETGPHDTGDTSGGDTGGGDTGGGPSDTAPIDSGPML